VHQTPSLSARPPPRTPRSTSGRDTQTIYRNTEESHPDYANLGEALVQMEKIVDYINEAKRATENSQKIMEIQSNIDGGEV
jgi:hypothetical protein